MSSIEKMESVQKVGGASGSGPADLPEDVERIAPNKEHFQNLMNSTQPLPSSFQKMAEAGAVPPVEQPVEENPIMAEEGTSVQKSGTATDDEQKGGRQRQDDDDNAVEAVSSKSSKKSSIESSALLGEVNKIGAQVTNMSQMSPEKLKSQVGDVISQLDQIKTKLSQTTGEIKPSYQTLLRNRLSHIDENLQIALSKAGVEYTPPVQSVESSRLNPIVEFIDLLTRNADQANQLNTMIDNATNGKGEITPANMFKIQLKVHNIQQQIELFTNMLNKALESIKTIMNVQV